MVKAKMMKITDALTTNGPSGPASSEGSSCKVSWAYRTKGIPVGTLKNHWNLNLN